MGRQGRLPTCAMPSDEGAPLVRVHLYPSYILTACIGENDSWLIILVRH